MRQHWLVGVVERAGHSGVALPPDAGVEEAWPRVERAVGLSASALAALVARHFHLGVADLASVVPAAARLVPEKLARQFHVFPVREDDRRLIVATSDPLDVEAEQMLGFTSGRTPVFVVAPPEAIESALNAHYAPDRSVESLLETVEPGAADGVSVVEEPGVEAVGAGDAASAPVIRLTNALLQEAVSRRASDIHLEPGRAGGVIRFRVDGVMQQFMHLPMPALVRVVSRIKILARLDIADRLRPQDGRARIRVKERLFDLRISTVPTRDSEKVVIRVLDPQGAVALAEAGFPRPEEGTVRRLLGNRDGIVLVTGPTGSGKTTTLYACIQELAQRPINIMTVEDPVEYELKGITQIQVERKQNVTFASALRAALRQDPDVILVGEIRDLETAEIAVRASITGHLVLGTLHANDALAAVPRLRDLGVDRTLLADAVRGVLAQRLLRRVCRACAIRTRDEPPNEREARLAAVYGVRPQVRSRGCEACRQTGFRGRIPVPEVAVFTAEIADLVRGGAGTRELTQAARAAGMRSMRDVAAEMVQLGLTTLEEVDRVFGEASQPAAETSAEGAESGGAERAAAILVVDDDPLIRTMARGLLEQQGYAVAEAEDGAEALRRIGGGDDIALLVLDLDLPVLDGRAVLKAVRGAPATAALPVLVLTGEQDEGVEVSLLEAGADDYVRKPIEPARFVARARAALRRAAS